jgi:RNA polymerase sigma factor (sigma-70 family)
MTKEDSQTSGKINMSEVVKMCQRLARKYKVNHVHFEDLVSEGVLESIETIRKLEELGEQPSDHWGDLYRNANTRMHDYLNLGLFPVHIPASKVSRKLARNLNVEDIGDNHNWSEQGVEHLRNTLKAQVVTLEAGHMVGNSYEVDYEEKDFNEKFKKALEENLNDTENLYLHMRFVEDMTQEEIAGFMQVQKPAISKREKQLLEKLRDIVPL